jgi:hypothetical protein
MFRVAARGKEAIAVARKAEKEVEGSGYGTSASPTRPTFAERSPAFV